MSFCVYSLKSCTFIYDVESQLGHRAGVSSCTCLQARLTEEHFDECGCRGRHSSKGWTYNVKVKDSLMVFFLSSSENFSQGHTRGGSTTISDRSTVTEAHLSALLPSTSDSAPLLFVITAVWWRPSLLPMCVCVPAHLSHSLFNIRSNWQMCGTST